MLQQAAGQGRMVSGVVLDSVSRSPLSNVSVTVPGTGKGTMTDAEGKFHITLERQAHIIRFTLSGYTPYSRRLPDSLESPLTVLMSVTFTTLQQIYITKRRYRNKNNPAVDLIREVIAHKPQNEPASYPFVTYDSYDKVRLLADRPPRLVTESPIFRKYAFLFTPDSTVVPGKKLIPAYVEETLARNYARVNPIRKKQVILGHKRVDLGEFVDMGGITAVMNHLYQDFSIYDNNMMVYSLEFMSPVAKLAPELYQYYLGDTVDEEGIRLIRLYFTPRNPEDLLFRGNLFITLDGRYAIRRVEMDASTHGNINWVRSFHVRQTYDLGPGDRYYCSLTDILSYFSLVRNNLGFVGEHAITVFNVSDSTLPDIVFHGLPVDTALMSVAQPDSFWEANRPTPLTQSEARTYVNTDSLLKMKSYHRLMNFVTVASSGYINVGKVDIGPLASTYSFNPLEGSRFQVGGRTNAHLSKTWYTEGYLAYGEKDKVWKYELTESYSLNHKSIYTYPFHYIQASFLHDTRNPGQETEFSQNNRFLYSFSRGIGGKWLYSDVFNLDYVREIGDHFSWNVGLKYWHQVPALDLYYIYDLPQAPPDTIQHITSTQVSATLGWAPHQQFYQGRATRRAIVNKYPVITFQYSVGIKGLLGGEYNYNAFHLLVSKRWYLAPVGHSDLTLEAGYITGNLPFPLMVIHPANPAYYYSFSAFNLMNTAEFVSDHYAGLNVDHYFDGFFFNKIPLLKKLRWREVVEAKFLYGGTRPENNPDSNPYQMKFPLTDGANTTYVFAKQPYFEAGFGIYNIFNILRLDFVHRFTYLEHPGVPTNGVRFSLGLNF